MNAFVEQEELTICPYDKHHTIMKSKVGFHLVKCRKNHPGAPVAICDYNHEHRVPKPELQYHYSICEARIAQEARPRILQEENVMSFPIVSDIVTPTEDSWGQLNYTGYDSEAVIDKNNVLRSIAVEKPSTKKQFRAEEQRRMNAIRAPSAPTRQCESSSSSIASTSTCEEFVDEENPGCSLVERIRRGGNTVYETTNPEETEWTTQTKKKPNKK